MVTVSRWWSTQGNTQRLDIYVRWGLYLTLAAWSVSGSLPVLAVPNTDPAVPTVYVVVAAVQCIACIGLLRAGLSGLLGGPALGRRPVVVAATVTALSVVIGAWAFADIAETSPGAVPVVFLVGVLTAALSPVLDRAALAAAVLVGAAGTAVYVGLIGGGWPASLPVAAFYLVAVGTVVLISRLSVWMLVLVWELDAARAAQARLAVAEERLRFARDVHDTLGRSLTLIAVTSDLAAGLARRGDPQAVDKMLEVRRLAHESAREVREVVTGYRAPDLATELTGARSVLRAAGITTRIIGDGVGLPEAVQITLGWVLREAITNVIRHSDATGCTIELGLRPGPDHDDALLRVHSDGARPPDSRHRPGHGLAGLRERVTALGGQLCAGPEPGGWFTVEARLPVVAGAPAAPGGTS